MNLQRCLSYYSDYGVPLNFKFKVFFMLYYAVSCIDNKSVQFVGMDQFSAKYCNSQLKILTATKVNLQRCLPYLYYCGMHLNFKFFFCFTMLQVALIVIRTIRFDGSISVSYLDLFSWFDFFNHLSLNCDKSHPCCCILRFHRD